MKNKQPFAVITKNEEWEPNTNKPLDIAKWIWGNGLLRWVANLLTSRRISLGSTAFIAEKSNTPPDNRTPEIIGAGALMGVGAGMIIFAFLDPEPTIKLGLLVGGGATAVLAGGAILMTIILTRENYKWKIQLESNTKKLIHLLYL